jgi:hypothetical protein
LADELKSYATAGFGAQVITAATATSASAIDFVEVTAHWLPGGGGFICVLLQVIPLAAIGASLLARDWTRIDHLLMARHPKLTRKDLRRVRAEFLAWRRPRFAFLGGLAGA